MTDLLEFLLGVDRIDLSQGGEIRFSFLAAWPAWVAFIVLLVAVGYIWRIYRRENPGMPGGPRVFLMVLRCLIVLLALIMIWEPALVLIRNETIRSAVAVLVDRSASMTVTDGLRTDATADDAQALLDGAGVDPSQPGRPSRFELARAVIGLDGGAVLKRIAEDQRAYLYLFDESPELLARIDVAEDVDEAVRTLAALSPAAPRTAPVRSMEMVLEQLAGQTLTGLVLVTDGQSTVPTTSDKLKEMAEARGIPLLTIGLGSVKPPNDLELRNADAKRWAFVSERPLIRITLVNQGLQGQTAQLELNVKGHEELNISRPVVLGKSGVPQTAELRIEPEKAGTYEVAVRLEPLPGEFDQENNAALPLKIDVLDRKPKVLLIEDLPRWEYQYLKNALYRDRTIQLSALLHSADLLFAPEGDLPIKSFPATRKELFEYDVIIIGDVDRRMFGGEQLVWIEEFVREKGGGVIFIAGDRLLNPNTYVGTPLETLLPIVTSDEQLTGNITLEWKPEMTIEGSVSPILRLEKDLQANSDAWRDLPELYWYYQAQRAKEGAQVLLVHPEAYVPGAKFPIMVMHRVGAGRVFFSATDETWRWRYYTGRRYFNNFWLQLVRYMALPQEEVTVDTGRLRYALGDEAKVTLRVADRQSVPDTMTEARATVIWTDPSDGKKRSDDIVLQRTKPELAVFEAQFTPERTGTYSIVSQVTTSGGTVSAESEFVVAASREEFLRPVRDQDFLDKISAFSEGSSTIQLAEVAALPERIISRSRMVRNDLTDEIWDSPLALMLFIVLISTEWILRKKYRML